MLPLTYCSRPRKNSIAKLTSDYVKDILSQFKTLGLDLELKKDDIDRLKADALTSLRPSTQTDFVTNFGAPLLYYKFEPHSDSRSKRCVLLLGGVHPDEMAPLYTTWKLLIQLLKESSPIVNRIIFIPLLNPDCFIGNREEGFVPCRKKVNGVDLNRDFYHPDEVLNHPPDFKPEPEIDFLLQLIKKYNPSHYVVMHSPLNFLELDGYCNKADREWINRVHQETSKSGGPAIPIKKFETYAEKEHMNWSFGQLIKVIRKTALTFEYPEPKVSAVQAKLFDHYYRNAVQIALDVDGITLKSYQAEAELIDRMSPAELADYAHNHYGYPSKELCVIGITGTNGKTTVSYLIGEVLKAAGHTPYVLGTLNSGSKDLSTPEALDTMRLMRDHLDQGGTHFVMEVTSEGIHQSRVFGIEFDLKILTNITQDHLDYHKTFEKYRETKLGFMKDGNALKIYPGDFGHEPVYFSTKLLGEFNLLNIKAAACALRRLNVPEHYIKETLSASSAPPGRLEPVEKGQLYMVVVDYAHTPDALENVLKTVKTIANKRDGKLFVLFGCGGDRDRGKRPLMGKIAGKIADFVVITDDNPRSESSTDIMNEIVSELPSSFKNFVLIQDRKSAIKCIIEKAQKDDVVILVGKGHETYQILKSQTIHFDDREEAENAILLRIKKDAINDDILIE